MRSILEVIGNDALAQQLLFEQISCDDVPGLYENLYAFYAFETCEMPYGTMKARDGDPVDWINRQARRDLEDFADMPCVLD